MKFLIVLGLFPLFSAQQAGYFPNMMAFRPAQGTSQLGFNNNNIPGLDLNNIPAMDFSNNKFPGFDFTNQNFPGFGTAGTYSSDNNKDNLSLDGLNSGLIQQLRFMTDSLASMMKQVAQNPKANEVFKAMDKICVSNMDETIEILKVGSNAAEKALLDAGKTLNDAVDGKLTNI